MRVDDLGEHGGEWTGIQLVPPHVRGLQFQSGSNVFTSVSSISLVGIQPGASQTSLSGTPVSLCPLQMNEEPSAFVGI